MLEKMHPAVLDRDRLAKVIYEASDEWDWNGVDWEHQYGAPKREALAQADAVLTALTDQTADVARVIAAKQAEAWNKAHQESCEMAGNCWGGGCPLHENPYAAQAEATSGE